VVDRAHPDGVASGEVVIDGDKVGAFSGERVEDERSGGDKGLSFTSLHFGDSALVKDEATDELNVEVAHAKGSSADFASTGKGFDSERVEFFATHGSVAQGVATVLELLFGQRFDFFFEGVDLLDDRHDELDILLGGVEKLAEKFNHLGFRLAVFGWRRDAPEFNRVDELGFG
jgi:hypothetical protein